ncbi:uncharacterized protein LOC129788428 [Lutzomyia longipalpis]|uniref:uncharacterized protein LOC129788428 n=1 Tax=Lutzomyia longipalpis TaxID=7200 RepID=UPI002483E62F|nr:uncharacterized protein LOC129788428 [Lutzomyia longipalpis]
MDWSPTVDSSLPDHPETAFSPEGIQKIDHKHIFESYATFSLPKVSDRSSRTPAQDRLLRLQNALRGETQKTTTQNPQVPTAGTPSRVTQVRPKVIPVAAAKAPSPTKPRQGTKRKAAQEEVKTVPDKKRHVGESPPAMPRRPKLRAKLSVNERLKRPLSDQEIRAIPTTSSMRAPPRAKSATVTSTAGRAADQALTSPPKKLKISPKKQPKVTPPRNGKDYRVSVRSSNDNRLIVDYQDFADPLESPVDPSDKVKDLSKVFYMVVDTNVFCHNLIFLENILNMRIVATGYAILFIPYIVLQELDRIKQKTDHKEELNTSMKAIKYINDKLQARHPQVKGQTAMHENELLISAPTPDDSIVNCCLQLRKSTKKVILLSNDINLRNKAICSGINAYRPKDIKADVPIEFL